MFFAKFRSTIKWCVPKGWTWDGLVTTFHGVAATMIMLGPLAVALYAGPTAVYGATLKFAFIACIATWFAVKYIPTYAFVYLLAFSGSVLGAVAWGDFAPHHESSIRLPCVLFNIYQWWYVVGRLLPERHQSGHLKEGKIEPLPTPTVSHATHIQGITVPPGADISRYGGMTPELVAIHTLAAPFKVGNAA